MEQGPHTYRKRWERERERTPEIGAIAIGQKVSTTWPKSDGTEHEVQCCDGYWLYAGTQFPTLYKVVEEIAGAHLRPRTGSDSEKSKTTANYSAARFFGLKTYRRSPPKKRSSTKRRA